MNADGNPSVDFNNTEIAFQYKNNAELRQGYLLFKAIGSRTLSVAGAAITNFALKVGLPIQPIIRNTIYKQFVGGQSIADCDHTIKTLSRYHVGSILDYSVEGEGSEESYEATTQELLNCAVRAKGDPAIPFTVFKVTGIGPADILEKTSARQKLSADEEHEYDKLFERCQRICQQAHDLNVPVFIDAEDSWYQPAIDSIATQMMRIHNKERVLVYNTYQMYRADKLADLKADHLIAKETGYKLGVKLVRGAYMEKERARALQMGYPSPIQPDKAATDRDYNLALEYCVQHINDIALVAGSHNEESNRHLMQLMQHNNIPINHPHAGFSQLLGMSDNLSFNLAHAGYNVTKYVPYGPVKAVMPYLFRRALENTSVAGQTSRELQLYTREMRRRRQLK